MEEDEGRKKQAETENTRGTAWGLSLVEAEYSSSLVVAGI